MRGYYCFALLRMVATEADYKIATMSYNDQILIVQTIIFRQYNGQSNRNHNQSSKIKTVDTR